MQDEDRDRTINRANSSAVKETGEQADNKQIRAQNFFVNDFLLSFCHFVLNSIAQPQVAEIIQVC